MKIRNKISGFTLIELIAVVAILGLIYALAIPKFGNMAGMTLRSVARRTAGLISYTYSMAVSQNKRLRLVFNYGEKQDSIKIEEWVEKSPAEMLGKDEDFNEEELTISEKEELEKAPKGEFVEVSQDFAKEFSLPVYVKIKGLYLYREEKTYDRDFRPTEDEQTASAIVFLPTGFADESIVYISDKKERVYSIKVNPITGKPTVFDEYVDPNKK